MPLLFSIAARSGESRNPWIPGQAGDDSYGGWILGRAGDDSYGGWIPGQAGDDSYGGRIPGQVGDDKRVAGDDWQVVIPANAGIHDFPGLPGCLIDAVDAG